MPGQNDDDGGNNPVDNDTSQFSSTSLDDVAAIDIFRNLCDCPDDVSGTTAMNRTTETSLEHNNLLIFPDRNPTVPQNSTTTQTNATTPISPPTIHQNNHGITDEAIPVKCNDKGRVYLHYIFNSLQKQLHQKTQRCQQIQSSL